METKYETAKKWWFKNVPFERKLPLIDECFPEGVMLPLSKINIIKIYDFCNPNE